MPPATHSAPCVVLIVICGLQHVWLPGRRAAACCGGHISSTLEPRPTSARLPSGLCVWHQRHTTPHGMEQALEAAVRNRPCARPLNPQCWGGQAAPKGVRWL